MSSNKIINLKIGIPNITYIVFGLIFIFKVFTYISYNNKITILGVPDTFSYYFPIDFLKGEIHPSRMFVYPALIKTISYLDFHNSPFIVVWFQRLIAIISLFYLWKTLNKILKYSGLALLFLVYYSTNDLINELDSSVLAESLSLSFLIFYFYSMLRLLYDKEFKAIYSSSVFVLLLVFNKPIFIVIFLIHLLILLYFVSSINIRCSRIKVMASIIVLIAPLFYHLYKMNSQYGFLGLSVISINNSIANSIKCGSFLESRDTAVKKHIQTFENQKHVYEIVFSMHNILDLKNWDNKLPIVYKDQIKYYLNLGQKNKKEFSISRLSKFANEASLSHVSINYFYHKIISLFSSFKKVSFITILYILIILYVIFRGLKINMYYLFLTGFTFLYVVSIGIGGVGDCDPRLMVFTIPGYVILFGNVFSVILSQLEKSGHLKTLIKKLYGGIILLVFDNQKKY